MGIERRTLLKSTGLLALAPRFTNAAETWSAGNVEHLVPAASQDRFLIKTVFTTPRTRPELRIGDQRVPSRPTDSGGFGHAFDVRDLSPDTVYELRLYEAGVALSEPWPLRTFPAPSAKPDHVRLLVFTCAGGHPLMSEGENSSFLPMATRRRLLERGLSFEPDAMIAIGDHVYWDQRTTIESRSESRRTRAATYYQTIGMLDRDLPARGTTNEAILKAAAGQQITPLYGTSLRSTPSYFLNDDHDYFENDEATDRFVTLPPYQYQREFFNFVRDLYLPEYLPDPHRPRAISGFMAGDLNRSFGALRWGELCEVLMYDCAGHLSLKGKVAGLVPDEVERWLRDRTADERIAQLLHVPSHPFGWSAGKWREWYPDVADAGESGAQVAQIGVEGKQFKLTTDKPKFMWQSGWWHQHQRLLEALAAQKRRPGVVLSGDLHATGHAQITTSGTLSFKDNPVNTIVTGPLGTGRGWPSVARGTPPLNAADLTLESPAPINERNGFTLVDVTPEDIRVRLFAWRRETAPVEAIDQLTPYHDVRLRRGAIG
jgi:hypothetical protein